MLQLLDRPAQPGPPPVPPMVDGPFICEAAAEIGPGPRLLVLARITARTNITAVWWLKLRAEQLAEQMPRQLAGPVRAWHADEGEHFQIRRTLALGQPYTVTLPGGDAEYRLTVRVARPVVRLDSRPDMQVVAR